MSLLPRDGLDVIVLDGDPQVSLYLKRIIKSFYTEGQVHAFNDYLEALTFCFNRRRSPAVFIIDVFLKENSGFDFLEALKLHYGSAAQDTIMVTGWASKDVVDRCLRAGINQLFEKPIKTYAFQLAVQAIVRKYMAMARILGGQCSTAKEFIRIQAVSGLI